MPAIVTISATVAGILRRACIDKDRLVVTDHLERKLYDEVNKVLVCLGGKWNRSARVHIFPKPVQEILDAALDDGQVKAGAKVVSKKAVQQAFYTPQIIAEGFIGIILQEVGSLMGLSVLEPSAGHGALVRPLLNVGAKVRAMDNDPDAIEELLKISSDRLAVVLDDFLTYKPSRYEVFDCIVMNPPFTKGQDALHVMKALQMVNSTGSVFAIMPSGWAKDRGPHKELQELAEYKILEELDSGAFKESGTMVATQIVRFGRRK